MTRHPYATYSSGGLLRAPELPGNPAGKAGPWPVDLPSLGVSPPDLAPGSSELGALSDSAIGVQAPVAPAFGGTAGPTSLRRVEADADGASNFELGAQAMPPPGEPASVAAPPGARPRQVPASILTSPSEGEVTGFPPVKQTVIPFDRARSRLATTRAAIDPMLCIRDALLRCDQVHHVGVSRCAQSLSVDGQ